MSPLLLLVACGGGGVLEPATPPEGDWLAPDAPAPLRRLTEAQLDRTLRDLFPGATLPEIRSVADVKVGGFENNATAQVPSALLVERLQSIAVSVTAAAMESPEGWSTCPDDGGADPLGCGRDLLRGFGRRAFRRSLTAEEEALYLGFYEQQLEQTGDFRVALQLGLQAFLNSPDFLYFFEFGASLPADGPREWLSGPELASRLSYLLWGTMPDDALLDAAERGELQTADGLEAAAWRLLEDPRARDGVLEFHRQWLDLDLIDAVWLHYDTYPQWVAEMNPSMRAELEDQVLRVWDSPDASLPALLLDRRTEVDSWLAEIYALPEGTTELPAAQRAGVLTRAGWLAAHAHMVNPSPVKRGVWVLDRLLCAPPPPPPASVDTSVDAILGGPAATNRERYEAHEADPGCSSCHLAIDGVGFGFEHHDSLGTWRDEDAGYPVDATGTVPVGDLAGTDFDGAVELSELLAASDTAKSCYATQWYRLALGRTDTPEDAAVISGIQAAAVASGGDLRSAVIAVVRSETFRSRPALR